MVRYIHPGNETLLAALNAAGVKVDLSSFLDTAGKNALRVVPEILNSSTGGFSPWAAQSFGGVLAANVAPFGDQASQFAQRPLTFDAQVQLRTAGVEYDARLYRFGNKATYSAATIANFTIGTAINSAAHFLVFHPATVTTRYELTRLGYDANGGSAGNYTTQIRRITAVTGGTAVTSVPHDAADAASGATVIVNPSSITESAGSLITKNHGGSTNIAEEQLISDFCPPGKGLVCRASVAEGWEILFTVTSTLTTSPNFNAWAVWTEE